MCVCVCVGERQGQRREEKGGRRERASGRRRCFLRAPRRPFFSSSCSRTCRGEKTSCSSTSRRRRRRRRGRGTFAWVGWGGVCVGWACGGACRVGEESRSPVTWRCWRNGAHYQSPLPLMPHSRRPPWLSMLLFGGGCGALSVARRERGRALERAALPAAGTGARRVSPARDFRRATNLEVS